jgi:hypothetical protein
LPKVVVRGVVISRLREMVVMALSVTANRDMEARRVANVADRIVTLKDKAVVAMVRVRAGRTPG